VSYVKLRKGRFEFPFLPTSLEEARRLRGWDEVDIVLVTGDAYVDHPAFGPILIARFLEARGFRVGVLAQPDWRSADPFRTFGRPRLFFGVAAGNLDSMLNKYTAQKRLRSEDAYSPGGRPGLRPERASIVYAQRAREAYPTVPIVLGGIEASLRRIAHYDYWSDSVRRSVLLDAKADLLVFGMGERAIWEVARRLRDGETVDQLRSIRGTAHGLSEDEMVAFEACPSRHVGDGFAAVLPSFDEVAASKEAYARMARALQYETNPHNGRALVQRHGKGGVFFNPPALPLEEDEMDALYDLPFNRAPHPMYAEPIPCFETVKHSVVLMRGCFGGCTFCSITEHEGRVIQSRSKESVLRELRTLRRMDDFRGVVSDLGGPTANMYKMRCKSEEIESKCRRLSCVHPGVCENLNTDHGPVIDVMRAARAEEGIKKVFVASGVRTDLAERSPEYIRELTAHHVGGQLSVAPEHVSPDVLAKMKKPGIASYERFADQFTSCSSDAGKEQYLIPYYISGHPGSDLRSMVELAVYLKSRGLRPRQVQDFIPTPMSVAATMYYTGLDPLTMQPVYVARTLEEKRLQKALLLYWDPAQHELAREALRRAGRSDLIGSAPHQLVPHPGSKGGLGTVRRGQPQAVPRRRGAARS
jgi:uncharacterized radical SAM protein YgiQ